MTQFELVAMGGTFDIIHKGHMALLEKAFSISAKVIIGLTSDSFVKKIGKNVTNNYEKRYESLLSAIEKNFAGKSFEISKLENDFGPAVLEGKVQALVVSQETENKGDILNEMRQKSNLPQVEVIMVPMVMAQDGNRISTTRIRNSEIDAEGNMP